MHLIIGFVIQYSLLVTSDRFAKFGQLENNRLFLGLKRLFIWLNKLTLFKDQKVLNLIG